MLTAESEEELQVVIDAVKEQREKNELKVNVKKTKTIFVCRDHERDRRQGNHRSVYITENGQTLEQVERFKYVVDNRRWKV